MVTSCVLGSRLVAVVAFLLQYPARVPTVNSTCLRCFESSRSSRHECASVIVQVCSLEELLKRPHVGYHVLDENGAGCQEMSDIEKMGVEIEIKYSGFVARQEQQLKKMQGKFRLHIPDDIDYSVIPSLSSEAQEKLHKIRPDSIGQAARIGGVNPADISALLVFMEGRRRNQPTSMPEQPAPPDADRLQAAAA